MRSAIRQLEGLGYLKIVRERSTTGQYVRSRWTVSDQPIQEGDWAPYSENPVVEEPVLAHPDLGDQAPTNTEVLKIQKHINTTTLPPLATVAPPKVDASHNKETWLWLCHKLSICPKKTLQDCAGLDDESAIDVLAEVYECKHQGRIRTSVPQLMSSLIRTARAGKFKLSAGISLRKEIPEILRRQRAMPVAVKEVPAFTSREVPVRPMPPRAREILLQLRDEIALQGKISRVTRSAE